MRPLPSFRAIEAFVVVARAGSLTEAARRLGLSVPALSRRIHQLEADLGTTLLRRLPRGVALTERGADYFKSIEKAVDELHDATRLVRDGVAQRAVRVSLIPSLANHWLLPRLPDFRWRHPDIEIDLQASSAFVELETGRFDLAIRLGEGGWPGLRAEMLLPLEVFPVCSPEVARGIRAPEDLFGHVLIGPDHRPEFWPEWIAAAGLEARRMAAVRAIDSMLLYETAANGSGVAIGLDALVRPFLASGRLVRPLQLAVRSSRSFHLVRALGAPSRATRSFRRWLVSEARRSASEQEA